MDRYKECERVLKTAAIQQCKERGNLIRQDFVNIATVTAEDVTPVNDAGQLVRQIFSEGAAVDTAVLRGACSILLDTLTLIKRSKEQSTSHENTNFDNKRSLAFVSEAIKKQQFQENSVSANLCHIVDQNRRSCFADRNDGAVFDDFDDGFYELNVLQDDVVESSSDASAPDDDQEVMNTYITSYKNRYGNQGLTVLSDNGAVKKTQHVGISTDDDNAKIPRNLHMQHIFGITGQARMDIGFNAFEPYYEHGIPPNPSVRENGVTHYVGGMYPPLHTYYSKDNKGRAPVLGLISQNCLRRTFSKQKPNLADRLLQQSKQSKSGSAPFALLARDTKCNNNGKNALLINETVLRHHSSPLVSTTEHIAFIGKESIRTFKCNNYTARIVPSIVSQQREACSSLFTSEVSQGRMLSRMVQKLMRYEYVQSGTAAMWRSSTDAISKAISNIEWGCLWQDWNYFSGGLLTEIDMQRVKDHIRLLTEHGIADTATILRNVCSEFAAHLRKTKENLQGTSDVTEIVPQLVSTYIAKVLTVFNEHYRDLRNSIYMDLKSINNRGFQQTVTSILEAKRIDDGLKGGPQIKEPILYVDRDVETKMRLELLPTHRAEAADLLYLTSVDQIIGEDLMEDPNLSGEPFLNMLSLPQHPEVNARQLNMTSTALDLCKKCFEGYKNGSFGLEKTKAAKGLTVLNALVTLLKNYEKQFSGARNLRDFLGTAHR
ncbi:hypothetical protein, conserved [Babesia ovata]|uniref:Uncharacterized protein n=1 Tax=Babesia ovata TaxID=189622 RepID=A0A2H6KC18_9APIC|nr:uncharacterized protein BOVATA_020330 [Babesia ovata]GBE60540.1 hypothetical protein, conserved [Babesia ovata]